LQWDAGVRVQKCKRKATLFTHLGLLVCSVEQERGVHTKNGPGAAKRNEVSEGALRTLDVFLDDESKLEERI
jgi:hypothetical protein